MAELDRLRLLTRLWRSTRYCELKPSPEEELRDDGTSSIRTYLWEWPNRYQAARDFLGYAYVGNGPGGSNTQKPLFRVTPHYHKGFTELGVAVLYATQVTAMDGYGIPDAGVAQVDVLGMPVYQFCKAKVLYETLTYDVLEDDAVSVNGIVDESTLRRYVTPIIRPSAEYLSLPENMFRFLNASGNELAAGRPGKIAPKYDVSLTWHRVPQEAVGSVLYNPSATKFPIDSCMGKVNATTFFNAAPGTLLCQAPDVRRYRNPFGHRIYDVEYRFTYLPTGHNKLLKPSGTGKGTYVEVTTEDTAVTNYSNQADAKNIYDWAEFKDLFRVW